MNRSPALVLIFAATLAALSGGHVAPVAADANGVALCTEANDQLSPVIVSDGAGGAIVAWHDSRPTVAAGGVSFAQRVNATAVPQWSPNGVALSTIGDAGPPVIVSDGAGGAFVAFGGQDAPPRVQWINAAGVRQWGTDGVQLSLGATARDLSIARDIGGAGGAIVAWREDNGVGGLSDIHAQKVNAAGATQWGFDGAAVTTTNMNNETHPALISDGAGGAIIMWFLGGGGVRAQRLNASGVNQWGNTPLSSTSNNNPPALVSDGVGGAVAAWGGSASVFAQRLSPSGDRQWGSPSSGVTVSTTGNRVAMIGDGAGGATVTWQDSRTGNLNIFAQRLDDMGTPQWIMDGAEVCFFSNDQLSPTIVSDGGTGAIISWYDLRSPMSGADIYAERMDAAGAPQWTPNGVPLCTAANAQEYPTTASDGAGGAFVAWQDLRGGTHYDIYLQRVSPAGVTLDVPPGGVSLKSRAWPDPFSDRVQMAFELPSATPVRMEVLDLQGRMVRSLGTSHLDAGPQVLTWDGRDSAGHPVGAGIYFLRVSGHGLALTRSVVRLN